MKTILFFLLISLTANLFGQEENQSSSSDYKKLLIGVSISPDYCFRRLSSNWTDDKLLDERNSNESPKIGYTLGLTFNYMISNRFGIGSGLLLSNKGYQSEVSDFNYGDMLDIRSGFIYNTNYSSNLQSASFIYNDYYFDLPTNIVFFFGEGNLRLIVNLGLTTNILMKTKTTRILSYTDGTVDKSSSYNSDKFFYNFSTMLSLGLEVKIKNKNFIRIEPGFRYGILKNKDHFFNNRDYYVGENLWNVGLNISYYFGLN